MVAKSRLSACLSLAFALCLSACRTLPSPSTLPTPPIVKCEQGKTEDVPAFPMLGARLDDTWAKAVYAWANRTLGIVTKERQLRSAEHDCLGTLRDKGVIR